MPTDSKRIRNYDCKMGVMDAPGTGVKNEFFTKGIPRVEAKELEFYWRFKNFLAVAFCPLVL